MEKKKQLLTSISAADDALYNKARGAGMEIDRELLKGSISLLLLNLLSRREMYGYEILPGGCGAQRERVRIQGRHATRRCTRSRRADS